MITKKTNTLEDVIEDLADWAAAKRLLIDILFYYDMNAGTLFFEHFSADLGLQERIQKYLKLPPKEEEVIDYTKLPKSI